VLVASTPPVTSIDGLDGLDEVPEALWASSSRPARGRLRAFHGSRPRRVAVGAAAAVGLIIGGTSYGLASDLSAESPPPATHSARAAGLAAVTGCSQLTATTGTLEQVNGSDLVLKTPDGQTVTVTTSPSTQISREVAGSLDDVTDGAHVFVSGLDVGGTINARNILLGTSAQVKPLGPPQPPGLPAPGNNQGSRPMSLTPGLASGTVTDAHEGGFTVVLSDGTQVPVTTGTSTSVVKIASASLSQLQSGVFTVAVGNPGANGTLAATTVEQGSAGPGGLRKPLLPSGGPKVVPSAGVPTPSLPAGLPKSSLPTSVPPPHPKFAPGGGLPNLPDLGCKPSTIATAALVVLG
jgi:hypothetical protein